MLALPVLIDMVCRSVVGPDVRRLDHARVFFDLGAAKNA
jgi:uncharacterized Zn-finger protein